MTLLGFSKTSPEITPSSLQTNTKTKIAWDIALAPLKSLPMNAFMLYMSGNSVQIFSIMATFMLLLSSLKSTATVFSVFREYKQRWLLSIVFVFSNMLCFAVGLYKCHSMGLLTLPPLQVIKKTSYFSTHFD